MQPHKTSAFDPFRTPSRAWKSALATQGVYGRGEMMDFMSTAQLLGNIGEFVGGIGVLVTLMYLAVQIRNLS